MKVICAIEAGLYLISEKQEKQYLMVLHFKMQIMLQSADIQQAEQLKITLIIYIITETPSQLHLLIHIMVRLLI